MPVLPVAQFSGVRLANRLYRPDADHVLIDCAYTPPPEQARKIAAIDLPFLPPRSKQWRKAQGYLERGNPKRMVLDRPEYYGDPYRRLDFARHVFCRSDMESQYPRRNAVCIVNRELTSRIVSAYVRRSHIVSDQLATVISTVYEVITSLGKPTRETGAERNTRGAGPASRPQAIPNVAPGGPNSLTRPIWQVSRTTAAAKPDTAKATGATTNAEKLIAHGGIGSLTHDRGGSG